MIGQEYNETMNHCCPIMIFHPAQVAWLTLMRHLVYNPIYEYPLLCRL